MNFICILLFLIFDVILHDFLIRWEIKYNPDLFKDLELCSFCKYSKNKKSIV